MNVLIVDQCEDFTSNVEEFFEREGHCVFVSSNPDADSFSGVQIHAFVLGLPMAEERLAQFVSEAKKIARTIIVVLDPGAFVTGIGADGVVRLPKTVSLAELAKTLT